MLPSEQTFTSFTREQAAAYVVGRGGSYPPELYSAILEYHQGERNVLLDVGCGPGKVVFDLLPFFETAVGTDLSKEMIEQATHDAQGTRARFEVCQAEKCGDVVEAGTVDLITVAMAAHWFHMPAFYASAANALRPGGTLAIWTCSSYYCNPNAPHAEEIQQILSDLEDNSLGSFMEPGNIISRNAYDTLAKPWDSKVAEFTRETFVRKDWDRNGVPSNGRV